MDNLEAFRQGRKYGDLVIGMQKALGEIMNTREILSISGFAKTVEYLEQIYGLLGRCPELREECAETQGLYSEFDRQVSRAVTSLKGETHVIKSLAQLRTRADVIRDGISKLLI